METLLYQFLRRKRSVLTTVAMLALLLAPATTLPAEEIYKIGGDVTPPILIHRTEPDYTKRAKKAKIEGSVLLSAVVNSEGLPEDLQVVTTLDPDLDAQAIKAVTRWRFQPGEKSGKPVSVKVQIEVRFRLF